MNKMIVALQVARLVPIALLLACNSLDDLLDVELSGQISAEDAETPSKAASLVEGGITIFNCALAHHINQGGVLGDELVSGPGFATYDDRNPIALTGNPQGCPFQYGNNHYALVAEARWLNDRTLSLLEGWTDAEVAGRMALIARAAAYSGYSHLLLAEGFCTAVIDGGPQLSSADVFRLAETRFTRAIEAATAASNAELLNLARVGRARARLGLGRLPDARADASLVPVGYSYLARYPATTPGLNENIVYQPRTQGVVLFTVDPMYRNVAFAGVADSRVAVTNTNVNNWARSPLWVPAKYASTSSPIEVATWQEAQLIVAEADVAAGNIAGAVGIINDLHARANLPPFTGTTAAAVMQQIIYERRAELFLEGQHIGDYRRYQLPFVPAPGTPYTGAAGVTYGNGRCLPLPAIETPS